MLESPTVPEPLGPWGLKNHAKTSDRFFWIFLDAEFGAGTTGRVRSESRAPESPMEASSRITGVSVPDLFGRWVGALLTQKYTKGGPHGDSAAVGHWNTFDALREDGGAYTPVTADLERNGFHALRLSDGRARGPRRLRLDPASPGDSDWRLVVVGGKNACVQVLRAGQESLAVFLVDAIIGVCVTGPTSQEIQRYKVTVV